jgi:hypothetical protein
MSFVSTAALVQLRQLLAPDNRPATRRIAADIDAALFHAKTPEHPSRLIVGLFGGTGTGKSTTLNRLLAMEHKPVTASSFKRTFTAGPVAIVASPDHLPAGWLDVPHEVAKPDELPVRGKAEVLMVAAVSALDAHRVILVDTPDLDGDQPQHHQWADRTFRWCQAVVFVVSPEKYQMPELRPYFRLATRYGIPCLFVMNKSDSLEQVNDCRTQLAEFLSVPMSSIGFFAIARDDSTFQPPPELDLPELRKAIARLSPASTEQAQAGVKQRVNDVLGRLRDQVIEPMRGVRTRASKCIEQLNQLVQVSPGIDVDPMTRQLRKRLQERSVLYLMGPGRLLDRLKTAPAMLAKLPRTTWDFFRGNTSASPSSSTSTSTSTSTPAKVEESALPDFRSTTVDQFRVVQTRIAQAMTDHGFAADVTDVADWKLDADLAGRIIDDELADLQKFLEERWNRDPRDTLILLRLLKYLPGGQKLLKATEAAPYLLVVALAAHHAVMGPIDLLVIGGFTLATWLGEKLSSEVAQRTRQTNRNIDSAYAQLVRNQQAHAVAFIRKQQPDESYLAKLEEACDELSR